MLYFFNECADFPGGAVGGVVEENEAAGHQVVVNVFEVASALVIAVIAVYIGEGDRTAEAGRAIVDVGFFGFFGPEFEEMVAGGFYGVGKIVAAECGGVAVE